MGAFGVGEIGRLVGNEHTQSRIKPGELLAKGPDIVNGGESEPGAIIITNRVVFLSA